MLKLEHFLWFYMLFNLLFFTFALESIIIFTWVLLILTSFWIQGDLHLMMIHVLLIVFIDVACLYFADFNMIVNMFVVGKCLEVQWREFWFNVFWLIFFHNSVYKYQYGVFFGTASCARFCILWCRFLLMLIMLIVLIWVPFCWIYVSWFMLWTNAVFFLIHVLFSSLLFYLIKLKHLPLHFQFLVFYSVWD